MVEEVFATVIALLGTFGISFAIEKSPIKINPLTIVKKFLVGDICEKMDKLEEKITEVDEKVDENELDRIREAILTYKKSCDMGIPLSEHDHEYISKLYDKYTKKGGNSYVKDVVKEIKEYYKNQKKS